MNITLVGLRSFLLLSTKVKSMQRSGTEAIRTKIQPSKQKREITNITNSQNTKRTYDQPSEQLFPKRWPLSNRNRTKNNMKRHRNSDTKNRQQRTTIKLPPWSGTCAVIKCACTLKTSLIVMYIVHMLYSYI